MEPTSTRNARLKAIADKLETLTESPLYHYRREHDYYYVLGEGDVNARIMLIGEAPGEKEANSGRPFVGAAGRVLSDLLESIGLKREDVYITNIVKDRPPGNRDPKPDEIALYSPLLREQIDIIQPRVIVTLGRFSMDFILGLFDAPEHGETITALHGKAIKARAPYGEIVIVPLYHPAVAFYDKNRQGELRRDIRVLKQFLA